MVRWLKYAIVWAIIVALLGTIASHFTGVHFWTAAIIAAAALVANGIFAEWEDRRPGGFYNPKDSEE